MTNTKIIPNTFGIPATADRYLVASHEEELRSIVSSPDFCRAPHFLLGGGSNVVFAHHFNGTILHLENKGITLVGKEEDGGILVEAAAGEVWDDFVRHCISQGWYGTENLVAIPGTVGASPVQNVGAYGMEAKDIIHTVRTFEIGTGKERIFTNEQCQFRYRDSIFKRELKDRYVVWSVTFRLSIAFRPNLQYKALSDALRVAGIAVPTPRQLADLIAEVRWNKLPRPEVMGSAGSFFKNPVVPTEQYERLKQQYLDMVAYPVAEGYKLAAGWLIEHAGWKGRAMGHCGIYERQALVLVNLGGCTGAEVTALADAVISDIREKYGVTLEMEAIIL